MLRGTTSNPPARFEPFHFSDEDPLHRDEDPERESEGGTSPRTRFFRDNSRTILSQNDSPDVGFRFSVNPYRGCEHGCIYCYARPTHEYLGLSSGLDFESKIFIKETAPELLRKELLSPGWEPDCISFSGVTDCYQPVEKRLALTRRCLEVLREFRNPFTVITKNHLVTRDIDLLSEMASLKASAVFVSVTTLDEKLGAVLEPRTSRPRMRLEAISTLAQAGIPVGVMMAPLIPGLTDHELPTILAQAAAAGARHAGFVPLRLPHSVSLLFEQWLEANYPDRKNKVLGLIRSIRGGKLNVAEFGQRMRGQGPYAEQIRALFHTHCRKNALNLDDLDLTTDHFQRPGEQMSLL